jgi:hypothetical protein
VAATAYAGAFGLATGADPFLPLRERLPLHSLRLGGAALTAAVAVPFSVLAVRAWRADDRTDATAVAIGAVLIGWIAVERAVVGQPSFLNPLGLAVGAAFVVAGGRALVRRPALDAPG